MRIVGGFAALGLDEQRPAQPIRRSALFNRADVAISSPCVALSRSGPRNRAVRWKLPSLFKTTPRRDQPGPGQPIGQQRGVLAVFGEVQHGGVPSHVQQWAVRMCRANTAMNCGSRARTPDRQRKWPTIQSTTPNPQLQAQPHGGGQRAVGDRHGARRPPSRIGSVSERCSGTSNPAAKVSGPLIRQPRRRS